MPDYLVAINPEYGKDMTRVIRGKNIDEAVHLFKEMISVLVVPRDPEEFHALENPIRY